MIRLGRISYVNMAPVFHRLTHEVEEVAGVPTELNRMLLAGGLDVAPISSIEYARNASRLRLLPRLCVSSEGAVDSIQLVTRIPLGQVRSVAVTPESATSVVLTRVLLPRAEIRPLDEEADARLLIGDAALRSAFEDPTPHHDLGRLWLERTGLPMVFAVWAAPEPVVDGLGELQESLVASVRLARSEPERLAHEASDRYGYPAGFLARYFEKLRYSFGPRERAGLLHLPRDGPRRRRARPRARAPVHLDRDRAGLGRERGRPRGAPVVDAVPELPRDREQAVEVEVDAGARLLRHLVLDRQVEVVRAEVSARNASSFCVSTDVRMCGTLSRKMRERAMCRQYSRGSISRPPKAVPYGLYVQQRKEKRPSSRPAGTRPGSRASAAGARAARRASRRSRSPSSPSSASRSRRWRAARRGTRATVYLNFAWRFRKSSVRISLPPPVIQWTPASRRRAAASACVSPARSARNTNSATVSA